MSDPSIQAQNPLAGAAAFSTGSGQYRLSDDLARLCLPQEFKDSYRNLAWVNSICALFLMVGLVGLKAPKVVIKPLSQQTDIVPVIFTPPEEQPKQQPEEKQEPDETPPDNPTDVPQVVTTVAVVDSPAVAFAVPVPGAVAVASMAHLATPPPPVTHAPAPKPVQFNPNASASEGVFPPPDYPIAAQRSHYQGTVMIEIKVAPDGTITSASVYKTSGFTILDEAALQVVKKRWRFAPGQERWLHWPCQFVMQ